MQFYGLLMLCYKRVRYSVFNFWLKSIKKIKKANPNKNKLIWLNLEKAN